MDDKRVPCELIIGGEVAVGWLWHSELDAYCAMDKVRKDDRGADLIASGAFRTIRSLSQEAFQGSGDIDCDDLEPDHLVQRFLFSSS